jgi:hypothetical protein
MNALVQMRMWLSSRIAAESHDIHQRIVVSLAHTPALLSTNLTLLDSWKVVPALLCHSTVAGLRIHAGLQTESSLKKAE